MTRRRKVLITFSVPLIILALLLLELFLMLLLERTYHPAHEVFDFLTVVLLMGTGYLGAFAYRKLMGQF